MHSDVRHKITLFANTVFCVKNCLQSLTEDTGSYFCISSACLRGSTLHLVLFLSNDHFKELDHLASVTISICNNKMTHITPRSLVSTHEHFKTRPLFCHFLHSKTLHTKEYPATALGEAKVIRRLTWSCCWLGWFVVGHAHYLSVWWSSIFVWSVRMYAVETWFMYAGLNVQIARWRNNETKWKGLQGHREYSLNPSARLAFHFTWSFCYQTGEQGGGKPISLSTCLSFGLWRNFWLTAYFYVTVFIQQVTYVYLCPIRNTQSGTAYPPTRLDFYVQVF